MSRCAGKKCFLSFIATTLAGFQVMAQQEVTSKQTAYQSAVVKATFRKINKDHYGPRPIDDAYSASVWSDLFQTLDPNSNLFLQGDVNQLAVYKNQIDEEMKAGTTTFFDAAYKVYNKRTKEAATLCTRILAQPFDLQKKETVMAGRKDQPFPVNEAAREDLWRKLLKYYTLRHYMEMEKAAGGTAKNKKGVDAALEAKAREKVRNWYAEFFRKAAGKNDLNEKFAAYLSVAVSEIDPHTAYTAPEDRSFNDMLTKRYCGIGVELATKESDFYIKRLMPGGAAYKSGVVKENDIIVAIADTKGKMQAISGWESNQVSAMIRGDKGTDVTLKLQQPGEQTRTVTVKRDELVDTENRAKSALIEKDGKTFGYVYLPLFYVDPNGQFVTGAAMDVMREVAKLREHEVDGIIMDLRGNGGGALDEVVRMSSCFMPSGPVTMLKSKDSISNYWSPAMPSCYEGPLTVLVDESSASASEIFTAAVQDRGRALVIGAGSTFGKGTAQFVVNMGKMGDPALGIPDTSYGSMRLTKEKFYRITGVSTQLRGVTPDIILQDRMSLESIMEKDYSSVLAYDSIAPTAYTRMPFTFNYPVVVKQANERIRHHAEMKEVAANMQRIKTLRQQPTPLQIDAFRQSYQEMAQLETALQQSRELKDGHELHMLPATVRSTNPATHKADPIETARTQEWLQKLDKDIYLEETVSVLEDMIANPK